VPPDLVARLKARLGGGAPAQRAPLEGPMPEELAAIDDWSSGDELDPEAEAAKAAKQRAKQRGRKKGGKTTAGKTLTQAGSPRGGKTTGGRNATQAGRSLGGKNQSRVDTQRGGHRGAAVLRAKPAAERAAMFQKGLATRRAKAAAAAVAELEAEGRAMDAALAALQERALPELASLMDELAVLRAGLRFSS
jgi:hypothetical protein